MSDSETVDTVTFDLRWKAARGLPVTAEAFHATQAIADARNLLSALDTVMLTRTAARRRWHVATAAPSEP